VKSAKSADGLPAWPLLGAGRDSKRRGRGERGEDRPRASPTPLRSLRFKKPSWPLLGAGRGSKRRGRGERGEEQVGSWQPTQLQKSTALPESTVTAVHYKLGQVRTRWAQAIGVRAALGAGLPTALRIGGKLSPPGRGRETRAKRVGPRPGQRASAPPNIGPASRPTMSQRSCKSHLTLSNSSRRG